MAVLCLCGSGLGGQAQPNAWTSPSSGNWEDLTWSLGVRPGPGQEIFVTNANWKAVQLTAATAQNFPQSMVVDSVTVSGSPSTFNTLVLDNVGVPSPLSANQVTVGSNSAILMLSSALRANYVMVNGTFNQGFFSGVMVTNNLDFGTAGAGTYDLSNGTLTVLGMETIGTTGWPATVNEDMFNQEGGFHYAQSLHVAFSGRYNLRGGQLGGNVQITGGALHQTGGDLSLDSLFLETGSLVQSGGTGSIGPTTVGKTTSNPGPPYSYTLSNGVPIFNSDVTITPYGIFDQEGGSNTVNGHLSVLSDVSRPWAPIQGRFLLNRGVLSAQGISVSGVFSQGGGTNRAAGDLTITGVPYSRYDLGGGWLVTSNTYMLDGPQDGNFIQTGGLHQVSGTLRVTGGSVPAYGLYGGQLIAPTIEITGGQLSHRRGTVSNTVLLRLNGGSWEEYSGNQQFGQLQMGEFNGYISGSLWLGTNSVILRFANSSGQVWAGGATLYIRNWSGSLGGGGNHQVIFGNNSSGLTPAQVAQTRFVYPDGTEYPARILSTGEIVPDAPAPPPPPSNTNSWISAVSGLWVDQTKWSLGVAPGPGQAVFITNAGWKAVEINASTAQNFPQSLTVDALTVSSPTNSFNTLFMNNVGVPSPLTAGEVTVQHDSALLMLDSALHVNGSLQVNGTMSQGSFSGVVATNLSIGNGTPGTYNLSNGTLTVWGIEGVGVSGYPSIFNQEGGYHLASLMLITGNGQVNLRGGQIGGHLLVAGGLLDQSGGDLAVDDLHVESGSVVQRGGTGSIGPTLVAKNTSFSGFDPPAFYALSNANVSMQGLTVGHPGTFTLNSGTCTVTGAVNIPMFIVPPTPGNWVAGSLTINGGHLIAGSLDHAGSVNQSGGTNEILGDLRTEPIDPHAYRLTGGTLMTANSRILYGGPDSFFQTGGRHLVGNELQVGGYGSGAYAGIYQMNGGQLVAPSINLVGGVVNHWGGTVSNSTLLTLDGSSWWEMTGMQQFGQLQLNSAATLGLATNSCVVRFANSSGRTWPGGGLLQIAQWNGSISGGGAHQIYFGNSASGLTTGQLVQIVFYYQEGNFPARILPTGEIVPDASVAPPFTPTDLVATAVSSNRIDLAWSDHAVTESGFKIERGLDGSNFVQVAIMAANVTNYSNTGLTPSTTYYYRVRVTSSGGDSPYSNIASARTRFGGPPPVSGLIAWWRAENSPNDSIGNHDGTTPAGIAYAPGKSGTAFDFNGQRVSVPDSPDFVLTNSLSVEGWIYPRQPASGFVFFRGDARPGLDAWIIGMTTEPGYLSFQIDNASDQYERIEALVQHNQWQHFAATLDGATGDMKLYVNGALVAHTNTAIRPIGVLDPASDPGVGIGNHSGTSYWYPFNGLVDEIALYSRALTPGEVQAIYNSSAAGKGAMPATLALSQNAGGGADVTVWGTIGRTYEVQTSSNLHQWNTWTSRVNASGNFVVTDGNAPTRPIRFYRAALLP